MQETAGKLVLILALVLVSLLVIAPAGALPINEYHTGDVLVYEAYGVHSERVVWGYVPRYDAYITSPYVDGVIVRARFACQPRERVERLWWLNDHVFVKNNALTKRLVDQLCK